MVHHVGLVVVVCDWYLFVCGFVRDCYLLLGPKQFFWFLKKGTVQFHLLIEIQHVVVENVVF